MMSIADLPVLDTAHRSKLTRALESLPADYLQMVLLRDFAELVQER